MQRAGELVGERADAVTIADLYDEVQSALERAFPRRRELWVRGEIQHVSAQRSGRGHCYIDLVDPETAGERQAPVLRVKCWQSTWVPLRAALAREGIELQAGMVVLLRGTLDFYRPRAEIGFILAELDVTALIGRLAAERAALLRRLGSEGLLGRNGALAVPAVPLRIGLVASPGTEGYRDFLGQLEASGFGFRVTVVPTTVQGSAAPTAIAAGISRLSAAGPGVFDVAVVVRGGGSKADLAAFDAEPVARAIATSTLPVWTGVGHTGDRSVADEVANRAGVTPTECGRELANRVRAWWERSVEATVDVAARAVPDALRAAERAHESARARVAAMSHHHLDAHESSLARRGASIAAGARHGVDDARARALARGARLAPLAQGSVARASDRVMAWRRLISAYDVERQLERGYTLTFDASGRLVRHPGALEAGQELVTRFAEGTARSVVVGAPGQDGAEDASADRRADDRGLRHRRAGRAGGQAPARDAGLVP